MSQIAHRRPRVVRRSLTPDDADLVAALIRRCEQEELGGALIEIADVIADWQRPSFNLETDSRGIFDRDRMLACGRVYRGRRAEVHVDPQSRNQGLGSELMLWTWQRALAVGSPRVGQTVPESNRAAVELFQRHGYTRRWTSWLLRCPLPRPPAESALPAGFAIREFVPGQDDVAAFQTIEDAFNEWPDREPSTFGDWAAQVVGRPGFDPAQLLLAVSKGGPEQVVGACVLVPSADSIWIHQLAVRRDHRGRGLGAALLEAAFQAGERSGASRAELSTDSRTGALGLYHHVGMVTALTFGHFAKELAAVRLAARKHHGLQTAAGTRTPGFPFVTRTGSGRPSG